MKNKFIILLLFSILNIIHSFNFNHLFYNKININNNKKIKDIKTLPLDKLPNYNTYGKNSKNSFNREWFNGSFKDIK